eukprot:TRINITY_DN24046_c0_g1_i2.p2 TRINITY_DN24046_c0_g1~~TRINITY_DN24046_c0_g1_i2.p2  ORF type:complete len:145 (+),score=38.58 TRINITY_DN24046_c0_g1_i2:139-573(+)
MIRRPPRSTHCISSAASDVYKRQDRALETRENQEGSEFIPNRQDSEQPGIYKHGDHFHVGESPKNILNSNLQEHTQDQQQSQKQQQQPMQQPDQQVQLQQQQHPLQQQQNFQAQTQQQQQQVVGQQQPQFQQQCQVQQPIVQNK